MLGLVYGVERHFQQYFATLWRSVFIGEEKEVPGENHLFSRKSLTNFIT